VVLAVVRRRGRGRQGGRQRPGHHGRRRLLMLRRRRGLGLMMPVMRRRLLGGAGGGSGLQDARTLRRADDRLVDPRYDRHPRHAEHRWIADRSIRTAVTSSL